VALAWRLCFPLRANRPPDSKAFYSLCAALLSRRSNLGWTLAPVLTLIFIFIVCARLLLFQLKDASQVIRAEYKLGETSFASCFPDGKRMDLFHLFEKKILYFSIPQHHDEQEPKVHNWF
jgi:hypothetical protein